jgi:streptogramin lyase
MGLRVAPQQDVQLDVACRAVHDGSGNPLLLWAANPDAPLAPPQDRAAAAAWLERHAGVLGFAGFTPAFARRSDWQECDVWTYALRRDDAVLFDAEVSLYWQGETCVGLLNRTPRIVTLPGPDAPRPEGRAVLYALRDGSGTVVLASERVSITATHTVTEVVHGESVLHRILEQREWSAAPQAATITEYTFPGMNFPDQIWADSKGLIWFSEPQVGRVSVFDPTTNTFRSFPTPGYSGNDGLQVDDKDRVWFGLYNSGNGLGVIDAATTTFTRYPPPYSGAQMAIPTQTTTGTILVTDHIAEKVSEFDPKTGTWLGTITMPAPSYPVGGTLERETGYVWFPLYFFHGLGRWQPGATSITRIAAPSSSGPAFIGISDGKVYFTYWLTNKLGVYDTKAGTFTEHLWRAGELGGPMAMAPNGHAVVGTRSRGYIAVFDPISLTFVDYVIPSVNSGLKDGLTVAPDGVIWFTLTFTHNKIAKLVLP